MATEQSDKLEKQDKLTLPNEPVQSGGLVPTKWEHDYMKGQAMMAAGQGLLPSKGRDKPAMTWQEAYLIMSKGREVGLPPLASLEVLYTVNNKVAIMAKGKLALLAERGGFRWKYNQCDNEGCEFVIWPEGRKDEAFVSRFTAEDAKRAMITKNPLYNTFGPDMYRAKAVARGIDAVAPHVCLIPTYEDMVLRPAGQAEERDDVLPHARVVEATVEDAALPEEFAPNESGYVLDPAAREAALRMMKALDYPAQEQEALLAGLTSDEEAGALAARLKEERAQMTWEEPSEGDGEQQRLIPEDDGE